MLSDVEVRSFGVRWLSTGSDRIDLPSESLAKAIFPTVGLSTEGFRMGSKYRNGGVRAVWSSVLATGLGLSVMVTAPGANAVEIPGCENIGQPGVIGTATETGARFTWDNVGEYNYEFISRSWDIAAGDWGPESGWIDLGTVHEYVVPWSQDGVVTDGIVASVARQCYTDNYRPRLDSILVTNELAATPAASAAQASMRLSTPEVYRKTSVTNATISNAGQVMAGIRTKLKKGSPVWACVYELVDAEADKWDEKSCKKTKVKKGGKASIKVSGVKDGDWVEVYDAKDRLLVAWGASGGS